MKGNFVIHYVSIALFYSITDRGLCLDVSAGTDRTYIHLWSTYFAIEMAFRDNYWLPLFKLRHQCSSCLSPQSKYAHMLYRHLREACLGRGSRSGSGALPSTVLGRAVQGRRGRKEKKRDVADSFSPTYIHN